MSCYYPGSKSRSIESKHYGEKIAIACSNLISNYYNYGHLKVELNLGVIVLVGLYKENYTQIFKEVIQILAFS